MRAKDVVWNLIGLSTPAIVAAFTVPRVIDLLSIERFGLLTLAWGLVAFSGLFDLGIGRATTHAVARARGQGQLSSIMATTITAKRLSLGCGLAGGCVLASLVACDVHTLLNYSEQLHSEVTSSAYVLALVVPVQTLSATLRGINEAFEQFRGVSVARVIVGASTFLSPYLSALLTDSLTAAVVALVVSRLIGLGMYALLERECVRSLNAQATGVHSTAALVDRGIAASLIKFGGWITVSSVIYPTMMQADRFLIGSAVSTTAVAGYTIPYELIMQSLIVVGAITTVMFPRLSVLDGESAGSANALFSRLLIYSVCGMALVAGALALTLGHILDAWLSHTAPPTSVGIGQVLCLGLVPYTIGSLWTSLIHARGRADITAKIHLLQAPIYLWALYWSIDKFGAYGAAWAWTVRVCIDAAALVVWSQLAGLSNKRA
jgi:O-antigen/teichoic acid export membrane protein